MWIARRALWTLMFLAASAIALYAALAPFRPQMASDILVARLAAMPAAILAHVLASAIALFTGALQHLGPLRVRFPAFHRALGRVYVLAVLVGGVAALALAPFSEGGIVAHLGFGVLGVLWLGATLMAYRLARARRLDEHRRWMTRSYALTLAAVTLRIYVPLALSRGIPFETAYPGIAWLCWAPNLLFAEWLVRRRG
jgi:uncharacterized membrane protein